MHPYRYISIVLVLIIVGDGVHAAKFTGTNGDGRHEIRIGSDVKFECRVAELGNIAVMWSRKMGDTPEPLFIDDNALTEDERITLVDTAPGQYDLHIANVEAYDSGEYMCHMTTTPELAQTHQLIVKVPPTVHIQQADANPYIVRPGESFSLHCAVGGNPVPTVKWFKDDKLVSSAATYHVDAANAHTGVYRCEATNTEGTVERDISVKVQSNPEADSIKPRVRVATHYMPVMMGSTVNISCFYEAVPEPNIKWTRNGFVMNLRDDIRKKVYQSRHVNETEVILSLVDINKDDLGAYTCQADNYMGTGAAQIHVDNKPGQPDLSVEPDKYADKLRVSVDVPSPTVILEYEVKWNAADEEANEWKIETFAPMKQSRSVPANTPSNVWHGEYSIDGLRPSTKYAISARARNEIGWGAYSHLAKYETSDTTTRISRYSSGGTPLHTSYTASSIVCMLFTIVIR